MRVRLHPTYSDAAAGLSEFVADLARGIPWSLERQSRQQIEDTTTPLPGSDLRVKTMLGGRIRAFFRFEGDEVVLLDLEERT